MNKYICRTAATLLIVGVVVSCFTIAYAHMSYRTAKTAPRPAMLEAYNKALQALGTDTNKFYCVAADSRFQCALTYAVDTEWHFTFNSTPDLISTNGLYREVIVPSTGGVIIWSNMPIGF